MVIKKDTKINEIISAYPEVVKFFTDLNMSCGQCFAVNFDTIENGALMHGMDVSKFIDQLNQYLATLPTPTVSPLQK
ncbi:MAG: DUF1858 domain-containing protein [Nitrospinae bacterium]|jgi:hybrid cluster-associated redox disulfide protein|nr:DUF1858 domain-containing protein [Nitrospinota bacterium]MDA1108820.1 DUF1858 domain-containing protein [Nitrospinota bacterium]